MNRTPRVILAVTLACGAFVASSAHASTSPERTWRAEITPRAPVAMEDQLLDAMAPDESLSGFSVAIDGDRALVGAPGSFGAQTGRVYVFERAAGRWSRVDEIDNPDGMVGSFGFSVALRGNVAVIGEPAASGAARPGRAHRYEFDGSEWMGEELTRPGDAPNRFGTSVAISDQWIAVGAPDTDSSAAAGAVYVYPIDGVAAEAVAPGEVEADDRFGESVALSGDSLLVGAPGDDLQGMNVGAVYPFEHDGASWVGGAVLRPGLADRAEFGIGVALADGGRQALVGAPEEAEGGLAFVYVRSATSEAWPAPQRLQADERTSSDNFGASVALEDGVAVVGNPLDDGDAADVGSASLFLRRGEVWSEVTRFALSEARAMDALATHVAVSGRTVLAGGPGRASRAGLTATFPLPDPEGTACSADGRCESGFCVDGVCCESSCGGGSSTDCLVCSVAAGAAADGRCDPREAAATCDGLCGGAGTCDEEGMCSSDCPDTGMPDSGGTLDGGRPPVVQVSGCACRTTSPDDGAAMLWGGLFVFVLVARRRRSAL